MAYELKFGPGEKIHARVVSQREQRDASGEQLFTLDNDTAPFVMRDLPQQSDPRRQDPRLRPLMEDFVWREFDGEIVEVWADARRREYLCTHDDAEATGPYRVDEQWLTPR